MKTKMSNASKIRAALRAGEKPKEISQRLKVPINTVYTVNWKMKKAKRIVVTKTQSDLAKKLGVPIQAYAKEMLRMQAKPTPLADFVRAELANLDHDINRLENIRAFLTLRLQQLEQNGE